jgi:hypothetical protein
MTLKWFISLKEEPCCRWKGRTHAIAFLLVERWRWREVKSAHWYGSASGYHTTKCSYFQWYQRLRWRKPPWIILESESQFSSLSDSNLSQYLLWLATSLLYLCLVSCQLLIFLVHSSCNWFGLSGSSLLLEFNQHFFIEPSWTDVKSFDGYFISFQNKHTDKVWILKNENKNKNHQVVKFMSIYWKHNSNIHCIHSLCSPQTKLVNPSKIYILYRVPKITLTFSPTTSICLLVFF